MIYKTIFYRVLNLFACNIKNIPNSDQLPIIETINDLAVIALIDDVNHNKQCKDILKTILSPEQIAELLRQMLHLTILKKDPNSTSVQTIAALFRSDTLASYLLEHLLKQSKKAFARYLESEAKYFITQIYNDIVKNSDEIPELIPRDYIMSEQCQQKTAELLIKIHHKILEFLHNDLIIKYLLALIKSYAQHDGNVNQDDLKNFLLGNLANRVVSSTLSRYLIRFTQKTREELEQHKKLAASMSPRLNFSLRSLSKHSFEYNIANMFLAKIFTYLIATNPLEKTVEKLNFPTIYNSFLLNSEFRNSYSSFCSNLLTDNSAPNPFLTNPSLTIKKNPHLKNDPAGQELLLCLWIAVKEIYLEFEPLKERILKSGIPIEDKQLFAPLKLLYLPRFITELANQMESLIKLTKIGDDGVLINRMIAKLTSIKKIYSDYIAQEQPDSVEHGRNKNLLLLSSPRGNTTTEQPAACSSESDNNPPSPNIVH